MPLYARTADLTSLLSCKPADLVGDCDETMAAETAGALLQLLALVHAQLPGAHVVSLALLPKGEVWPNRCSDAITSVNARLQARILLFLADVAFLADLLYLAALQADKSCLVRALSLIAQVHTGFSCVQAHRSHAG
jgi:hypothetical protein